MFSTRITKSFAGTALAAGALGLAALVAAGTAGASTVDDTFLAALARDGLTVHDQQQAVNAAQWICRQLDQGQTPDQIAQTMAPDNPGLSAQGIQTYMLDSAKAYCPKYVKQN